MKPYNPGGHSAYQDKVLNLLHEYYPDADSSLPASTWELMERFWNLDLAPVDEIMQDRYSVFGPAPRLPSDLLRSSLLSVECKISSVTAWAADLKENPLHAIISGFVPGDTPGVGTFYDFFSRLWLSDNDNFSSHLHPPKIKPKKPAKKGEKAAPTEKVTVKQLMEKLAVTPPPEVDAFKRLFEIFRDLFLLRSADYGLLDLFNLSLAGDGTPVYTAAQERKKRTCDCKENGISDCVCNRLYSQPDCNMGWDSHRNRYFFGYDLYMLTASDSRSDLPVFPFLNPASRHDSHGFLFNWFSMKSLLPDAVVNKILLDSAHDAMPIYDYCRDNNITPFIDLNGKGGAPAKYKDDFSVGDDGVPVCAAGHKMRHDGYEVEKRRAKFKCPMISHSNGGISCTCPSPCSDAKYGRTVHLAMKDNPRLFNIPPRGSKEWKQEYNARTSAERCNKREKIDYKLEDGRHRSSKMWYCRLFCIMMCQHLDAWTLPKTSSLKKRFCKAA